ncbi:lipoate--protein ligase [Blochmannia endosymbiont of Camponotus (Colobopsis) obliquus]|uniref:lipoate--protein ligase n=1 Tax=Blochmannia endosymbiont of Camponotus (Colobopsis) obliquus TaxID=1505597 RepID=UPI00061A8850|nr:lipoate--protein ligase [Blochmannia endosymbiont of Camponotus (Colobopsis) obliquus]AKC60520.1 Lipoate-protein ligase A [Blochmannia endosymbiont of Camponotus (Colobopsis) obliquus]
MTSLRLLISDFHNPWFNLAIEECIFRQLENNQSILFLWRNHNTVVIGRAQNPWKECNTRRITRDKVYLARRSSGGGAVFHDLGNTCFTFISNQIDYNNQLSTHIILDGLKNFNINIKVSGRNDLVVQTAEGERKVSGSAYRESSYGKLHHGTLLLQTKLDKLAYYLNPDIKKLKSKGITSVRSRVANLIEFNKNINHNQLCYFLQQSFCKFYKKQIDPEIISLKNILKIPGFLQQLTKQSCWDWNFGAAPMFSHHLDTYFAWGSVTLHFDIKHGIITRSRIFTDSLYPDPLEALAQKLIGTPYNIQKIKYCCQHWLLSWPKYENLVDVVDWLINSIC